MEKAHLVAKQRVLQGLRDHGDGDRTTGTRNWCSRSDSRGDARVGVATGDALEGVDGRARSRSSTAGSGAQKRYRSVGGKPW